MFCFIINPDTEIATTKIKTLSDTKHFPRFVLFSGGIPICRKPGTPADPGYSWFAYGVLSHSSGSDAAMAD